MTLNLRELFYFEGYWTFWVFFISVDIPKEPSTSQWHCIGRGNQNHPQEKEMQKGKMVVSGGLTNSWEKREAKGKGEKERYTHLNAEF